MICKTEVNGMPGELESSGKWIVARLYEGQLWFWGAYETIAKAKQAQKEIGGVLLWN